MLKCDTRGHSSNVRAASVEKRMCTRMAEGAC